MSVPAERIIACTAVEVEVKVTPFDFLLVDNTIPEDDWPACPRLLQTALQGVPYPEGVYRVKYSLDPEGEFQVRVDFNIAGEDVFPAIYDRKGRHVAIVCFAPVEWNGKWISREVL